MEFSGGNSSNIIRNVIIAAVVILGLYVFVRFLLPVVLVAGIVIFLYVKIKGYLNKSSKAKSDNTYNSSINSSGRTQEDDLDGEVVDVDYKDV